MDIRSSLVVKKRHENPACSFETLLNRSSKFPESREAPRRPCNFAAPAPLQWSFTQLRAFIGQATYSLPLHRRRHPSVHQWYGPQSLFHVGSTSLPSQPASAQDSSIDASASTMAAPNHTFGTSRSRVFRDFSMSSLARHFDKIRLKVRRSHHGHTFEPQTSCVVKRWVTC